MTKDGYPKTQKTTETGQHGELRYGMASMQGWRKEMEDRHSITLSLREEGLEGWSFSAVFDGHSGTKVASYASKNLVNIIGDKLSDLLVDCEASHEQIEHHPEEVKEAIESCFLNVDEIMKNPNLIKDKSGSTAVSVTMSPKHHYIANIGDSRPVLSRRGAVHFHTVDHKPSLKQERERITKAGGFVWRDRVDGSLAMSRALGDFNYKNNSKKGPLEQKVVAKPDITIIERNENEDEFLVLACDGIFDVMSNIQVISYIRSELAEEENIDKICNHILDHCLARGSRDNMSIVVILFPGCPPKETLKNLKREAMQKMHNDIRARQIEKGKIFEYICHLQAQDNGSEDASEASEPKRIEVDQDQESQVQQQPQDNAHHQEQQQRRRDYSGINPFLLYFVEKWKKSGKIGNICKAAKAAGQSWKYMSKRKKKKYIRKSKRLAKKQLGQSQDVNLSKR